MINNGTYTRICGNVIMPRAGKTVNELVDISKRNCGKVLCLDCMKKEKERMSKGMDGYAGVKGKFIDKFQAWIE